MSPFTQKCHLSKYSKYSKVAKNIQKILKYVFWAPQILKFSLKNTQIEYVLWSIVYVLNSSLVHLKNSWYFLFLLHFSKNIYFSFNRELKCMLLWYTKIWKNFFIKEIRHFFKISLHFVTFYSQCTFLSFLILIEHVLNLQILKSEQGYNGSVLQCSLKFQNVCRISNSQLL